MNKRLLKLKAEIQKQRFNTPIHHCHIFILQTTETFFKENSVLPHLYSDQPTLAVFLHVYHFTPFKLCLQAAALTPPTSPQHTLSPHFSVT